MLKDVECNTVAYEASCFWALSMSLNHALQSGEFDEMADLLDETECLWLHSGEAVKCRCAALLEKLRPGWKIAFERVKASRRDPVFPSMSFRDTRTKTFVEITVVVPRQCMNAYTEVFFGAVRAQFEATLEEDPATE